MPRYISAFDYQQQEGLTRQQVIDLAEAGPTFLKTGANLPPIMEEDKKNDLSARNRIKHTQLKNHIYGALDECINKAWGKYTLSGEFILDGFRALIRRVTFDWKRIAYSSISLIEEKKTEYPSDVSINLKAHTFLQEVFDVFPNFINGETAYRLLRGLCPLDIQNNLNNKYTMSQILRLIPFNNIQFMFFTNEDYLQDNNILWAYLRNADSIAVDLFFMKIFQDELFFDSDDLPKIGTKKNQDEASATQEAATDKNNAYYADDLPAKTIQRKQKHGAISYREAAKALGKDERTIYRWEANNGKNAPKGYPGRENATNFYNFVATLLMNKAAKREIQGIRTAEKAHYSGDEDYDKLKCHPDISP